MEKERWTKDKLESLIKSKQDFILIFGVQGSFCFESRWVLLAGEELDNLGVHLPGAIWRETASPHQPVEESCGATEGGRTTYCRYVGRGIKGPVNSAVFSGLPRTHTVKAVLLHGSSCLIA